MAYGTCKICGCTDTNACNHPDFGPCWWIDASHEICSHCVELNEAEKAIHCKTHDHSCAYHACMSDDCQKEYVKQTGSDWGPGKCEKV